MSPSSSMVIVHHRCRMNIKKADMGGLRVRQIDGSRAESVTFVGRLFAWLSLCVEKTPMMVRSR